MKKRFLTFVVVTALAGTWSASAVEAQTIGFDDITSSCNRAIGSPYNGFTWSNIFLACSASPFLSPGTVSGTQAVFNGFGSPAGFSGSLFNLQSAYFTTWTNQGIGAASFALTVLGFNSGSQVHSTVLNLTQTTQLVTLNWTAVDSIAFAGQDPIQNWFVMDDVTIGHGNVVPEPATFLLLATGLLGIGGMGLARRR